MCIYCVSFIYSLQLIVVFCWGLPNTGKNAFNKYVLDINEKLAYVQLELRKCHNQYDGDVYYGVVNNVADEPSKLGTKYSAPQIAYYKGIVSLSSQFVGLR